MHIQTALSVRSSPLLLGWPEKSHDSASSIANIYEAFRAASGTAARRDLCRPCP
jgi:hypothetical protein